MGVRSGGTVLVNHHTTGSGEPLVLIHGIGHRWQAWEPVIEELAQRHTVIAIDLPGFGLSPVPDGGMPPDMSQTVQRVATWLAESGLERPHVAGNSLGGAIALELAARGLVSSATAFSPAGFFNDAERRRALGVLKMMRANTFLPNPMLKVVLRIPAIKAASFLPIVVQPKNLTHQRAYEDALALRRGKGFMAVAKAARDYQFAGQIEVPVTVAWGAKDRILQPHQAKRVVERLPQARHVSMPDCGHVPMSDNPALVASLILETTAQTCKED